MTIRSTSLRRLAALGAVLSVGACPSESIVETKTTRVEGGVKIADVTEVVRRKRAGGELVQRTSVLVAEPKDAVVSMATLDDHGFATGASYRREGPKGKRYVELERRAGVDGFVVFSRGDDESFVLPERPVVLWELRDRLRPSAVAEARRLRAPSAKHQGDPHEGDDGGDVTLLDLENAVAVPARLDDGGALAWSPLPAPKESDPVEERHRAPAPFLESKTPSVVTWCKVQAAGASAVEAAQALAAGVRPKLAPERGGGPPSALNAAVLGGHDQAGAALVTTCLRALGHPARVVTGHVVPTVGTDVTAPTAVETRTWAQVHDGATWRDVDPLHVSSAASAPGRSPTAPEVMHQARFEGFPTPLATAPPSIR
jgi:hypothetical protein